LSLLADSPDIWPELIRWSTPWMLCDPRNFVGSMSTSSMGWKLER
jgi:hypothetical protein